MTETSHTKIKFDWASMKFTGLTVEQLDTWYQLYKPVEVFDVITKDMVQWLDKVKGTKKANKRNWQRFICGWLQREQKKMAFSKEAK
jgi:hypothetical protein